MTGIVFSDLLDGETKRVTLPTHDNRIQKLQTECAPTTATLLIRNDNRMKDNTSDADPARYNRLAALSRFEGQSAPPIHLWHPEHICDIDMKIDRNGDWHHEGTQIKRASLTRLFSSVMRLEDDGDYFLVTPVEKCRIQVEDVPFQAILMRVDGGGNSQRLVFTSNMAEEAIAGADHPLSFIEETDSKNGSSFIPYIEIRDGLKARVSRNVYYQLMDLLEEGEGDNKGCLGVWSDGCFFGISESAFESR